jgi:hypothetical protein
MKKNIVTLALLSALSLSAAQLFPTAGTLFNGGTNNATALSTNWHSDKSINAAVFGDVSVFVSADLVGTLSGAVPGTLTLDFRKTDGFLLGEPTNTPSLRLSVSFSATNTTAINLTNWTIGAIPSLELVRRSWTGTNCFPTNLIVTWRGKNLGVAPNL